MAVKSREYNALVAAREISQAAGRRFEDREFDGIVTRHRATLKQVVETLRDWVEHHPLP